MKTKALLYLLLTLVISSASGQDLRKSLTHAYKKSDTVSLFNLLSDWNSQVQSNESEVAGDKYTDAVYAIFNEFYTPFDLKRIGSSEWGDSIYIDKFAVIQNSVAYVIAEFPNPDSIVFGFMGDTLTLTEHEQKYREGDQKNDFFEDLILKIRYSYTKELEQVEMTDFRPETTLPINKRLYLTADYRTELIQFLGNQHSPLGFRGLMNPARATKKTRKKQRFLNNYLNVIHGHWGGYWHLVTHPKVNLIIMNPELTKAMIHFRLVYQGGEAYLEKKDGKWVLIESKLTWIE